jgi:hypothetical protein
VDEAFLGQRHFSNADNDPKVQPSFCLGKLSASGLARDIRGSLRFSGAFFYMMIFPVTVPFGIEVFVVRGGFIL